MPDQPNCPACKGRGWILGFTGNCYDQIQRCDVCTKFDGDEAAYQALEAAVRCALLLLAQPEDRKHIEGVLEMLQQFHPFR